MVNVTLSKKIEISKGHNVTISAMVYNLPDQYQRDLDLGVYRDAGYVYGPRLPRSFRIGLKYGF